MNSVDKFKKFREESIDEFCECVDLYEDLEITEARTSENPNKKFKVYTMGPNGKVVVVRFGDPNMEIKRDDPARRKSFRARHNCDNPGPKYKARYWSCFQWRAGKKVDN